MAHTTLTQARGLALPLSQESLQPSEKLIDRRFTRTVIMWPLLICCAIILWPASAPAQSQQFNIQYTENKADQSLRGDFHVDPSTLGMSISIPLASYPGRGISLPLTLNYSSKLWQLKFDSIQSNGDGGPTPGGPLASHDSYHTTTNATFAEHSAAGWSASIGVPTIEYTGSHQRYNSTGGGTCDLCVQLTEDREEYYISRISVHLPDGSTHELRKDDLRHWFDINSQQPYDWTGKFYSVDGSRLIFDGSTNTLWLPDGSYYSFGPSQSLDVDLIATQYTDHNGNTIIYHAPTADYPNGYWIDTLGRQIPLPIPSENPVKGDQQYTLPGLNGHYTFHWRQLRDSQTGETVLSDPGQQLYYLSNEPYFGPSLFASSSPTLINQDRAAFNPVVLAGIDLPTGQSYRFTYNIYGEIEYAYLPTGGYEHYRYAPVPPAAYVTAPYDQTNRGVVERWLSADGTSADEVNHHWQYSAAFAGQPRVLPYTVTSTEPDGTQTQRLIWTGSTGTATRYGFDDARTGMVYEERVYAAGGQLLRRVLTDWAVSSYTTAYVSGNVTVTRDARIAKVVSIFFETGSPSALVAITSNSYDQANQPLNLTSTVQYGFAAVDLSSAQNNPITSFTPNPALILRSTEMSYLDDPTYSARNLVALPTSTRTRDSAGNIVAKSQISYDEAAYPLLTYSSVTNWVDLGTNARGNVTTQGQWLNTTDTFLQTHLQYDQCGNVRNGWDARGNLSQLEYSSAYAYAYPTRTLTPVPDPSGQRGSATALTTTGTYDFTTGRLTSITDANNQTTTFEYAAFDALGAPNSLGRLTKQRQPDGGSTAYAYGYQPGNLFLLTRTARDATHNLDAYQYFDALGRPMRAAHSEGAGFIYVDTQYDEVSRVRQVSNPYRAGESLQWTTTDYDNLGRAYRVTTPGGAQVNKAYGLSTSGTLGISTITTDAAGKSRKLITDASGNLIQVSEDPAGLAYLTSYTYDPLNNLRTVVQGNQTRIYTYDSLSRLTSAQNPEVCDAQGHPIPITYQYDENGNLRQRVDARSIITTYQYDALNRAVSRSYSDSTPAVSYVYDATASNGKGRLSSISNNISTYRYTDYDEMGRVRGSSQTTDGQTYQMSYQFDWIGHLIAETYPSGRTITNSFDNAGRLIAVTGQKTGEANKTYADSLSYWSSGAVKDLRLGNGLWEHAELNNRLQLTELDLGTSPGGSNRLKLNYNYGTSNNNGNVLSQTITVPTIGSTAGFTATQNYLYDAVNRLQSAEEINSGTQVWKQSYTYADPQGNNSQFGNRRIDAANTTPNVLPASNPTISPLTNRFDAGQGYLYDSAGNLIAAPQQVFTFDAENRQISYQGGAAQGGADYSYDGEGRRVRKAVGAGTTIFVYSAEGELVAEYSNAVASSSSSNGQEQTSYLTSDTLSTPRIISDSLGQVKTRHDYLPFGEELQAGTSGRTPEQGYSGNDNARHKWVGYERDAETSLDFAQARYYANSQGRFTSVDPLMASARALNPQTWNRYAYAFNSPLRFTDPSGMIVADFYNEDGKRLGTDGLNDGKIYIVTDKAEAKAIQATDKQGGTTAVSSLTSAVELPSLEVRQEIGAAVERSNSPTADDKKGGFHEEGGIWGTTADGKERVVPAAAGAYSNPQVNSEATINVFQPANAADQGAVTNVQGTFHVHPKAKIEVTSGSGSGAGTLVVSTTTTTTTYSFEQPPSPRDITVAASRGISTNIVVGAGNNKVYIYNGSGVRATIKLDTFLKLGRR